MRVLFFSIIVFLISTSYSGAQISTPRYKVAVFAPLYLDSAFDDKDEYRYPKNIFPKFINPGLEFYEGLKLALDSLNIEKAPLDVFIYDTRSARESLAQQLTKPEISDVQLIIAHCNSTEVKLFAEAGISRNIPVINVNLPNDGGANANPFFVVLNPTLRTQCEGIYRHLQKFYPLDRLVVFRKKGQLEDRIKTYFDDFAKHTASVPLKLKYVDLPDSFMVNNLRDHLDTLEQTLCIAGSLDEQFGRRLIQQLAALKKMNYKASVMGMPTWDNIPYTKKEFFGIEISYSTPFYHSKNDKVSQGITAYFSKIMYARPSDMVFRGYEIMFRFGRMLQQYGTELASNLSTRYTNLFTEFDIQPVLGKTSLSLDYFENKKLYFLKWQDGILKSVY